jgi:hypothetical protein
MRKEIYQKFNPIGKNELELYVKKLNIGNHSYDYEKRKEMLLRWASLMKCKWIQDETLKELVLEYMENDEAKLPTPLNVKDFASKTAGNYEVINKEELLRIIEKQSQPKVLYHSSIAPY